MARSSFLVGLVALTLAGPSFAADGTPARAPSAVKSMLSGAIAPLRLAHIYAKERSARDVGSLQRRAGALARRVTLTTLNPWSKRTLNDQIADCRQASRLREQGSRQLDAARMATVIKARSSGITVPRSVLQRWGMQPKPIAPPSARQTAQPR